MYKRFILLSLLGFISIVKINGQLFSFPKENPVELGKVKWLRNYDDAIKQSKEVRLPILILFQEVPGCSNCTKFGNDILSHPLIVEAIETCFVPLCIYNNKGGRDKETLEKFNEPTWNNPVIRIVDNTGNDLVPRQPEFTSTSKTIATIKNALIKSGNTVPKYLDLLQIEVTSLENKSVQEAYLSMYCFWSGEKEIAAMDGIISTEAGYMHGKEVVKIKFDKSKTNIDDLTEKAHKVGCADQVYANVQTNAKVSIKPIGNYRKDNEDKYYLSKSPYKVIPMMEIQKTKVNRAIALNQDPSVYLSPRQLSLLNSKKSDKNQVGNELTKVWYN